MAIPNKSFVVVINGPEANAGLKPNRFKISGVMVPMKEAKSTTQKSAMETTKFKIPAPKTIQVTPYTMAERKNPLMSATLNTLSNRCHKPSSTKLGLAKLCTTKEELWMPTLPPVA